MWSTSPIAPACSISCARMCSAMKRCVWPTMRLRRPPGTRRSCRGTPPCLSPAASRRARACRPGPRQSRLQRGAHGQTDDDSVHRWILQHGAIVRARFPHVVGGSEFAHGRCVHIGRRHDPRLRHACQPARVRGHCCLCLQSQYLRCPCDLLPSLDLLTAASKCLVVARQGLFAGVVGCAHAALHLILSVPVASQQAWYTESD